MYPTVLLVCQLTPGLFAARYHPNRKRLRMAPGINESNFGSGSRPDSFPTCLSGRLLRVNRKNSATKRTFGLRPILRYGPSGFRIRSPIERNSNIRHCRVASMLHEIPGNGWESLEFPGFRWYSFVGDQTAKGPACAGPNY